MYLKQRMWRDVLIHAQISSCGEKAPKWGHGYLRGCVIIYLSTSKFQPVDLNKLFVIKYTVSHTDKTNLWNYQHDRHGLKINPAKMSPLNFYFFCIIWIIFHEVSLCFLVFLWFVLSTHYSQLLNNEINTLQDCTTKRKSRCGGVSSVWFVLIKSHDLGPFLLTWIDFIPSNPA